MKSKRKIFLLPDITGSPFSSTIGTCNDTNPVEILGYALYTFVRRLDDTGFEFSCVAVPRAGKRALFYRHTCENLNGKIGNATFTETEHGSLIHVDEASFNVMDATDYAVQVKSGDWESEKLRFHSIAALHHLGVILNLSVPVFSMKDSLDGWAVKLNEDFATVGAINESLETIYRRMMFGLEFFGLEDEVSIGSRASAGFCFGPLLRILNGNPTFEALKKLFPISGENKSPLYILNSLLVFVARALSVSEVDKFGDILSAVKQFQKGNALREGFCDLHTATRIAYSLKWTLSEPLPIFRMAGIHLDLCKDSEFPVIQRIAKPLSHPLCEKVRVEINRSTAAMPDPKAKIEWMNNRIQQSVREYDAKCAELCEKVKAIEQTVTLMIRMTKDIMQESQSAMSRVETASRTLRGVYDAHNRIRGKFEILRDKLFIEQRNTRFVLLIGIIISFLGGLRVFWR